MSDEENEMCEAEKLMRKKLAEDAAAPGYLQEKLRLCRDIILKPENCIKRAEARPEYASIRPEFIMGDNWTIAGALDDAAKSIDWYEEEIRKYQSGKYL